jgi:hypothetical protein
MFGSPDYPEDAHMFQFLCCRGMQEDHLQRNVLRPKPKK